MRNFIIVLSALTIMVLGIYGSSVILFDQERLRAMIADQIEQQTGRRIEIHGEVKLRLFPGLRISAERVVMASPSGFDGPDFLLADHLQAQVRLLPLIRGQVDATSVRVENVRLNLHTDSDGNSSLDGLLQWVGSGERSRTGAAVSLDNLLVSVGSEQREMRESFELERMEVEGFAVGQPLQFRFRGSMGEPALFDYLEVDGLLVSTEADRLRLSNMRLAGLVDQGRYDLEMLGNVNLSLGEFLSFSVDGGRFNVNEHQFDLNMRYAGAERPSFSARLNAGLVDMDVLQVLEQLAEVPHLPDDSGLKTVLRGMDFDVHLGLDQLARLGLVVDDLDMLVTGRGGVVRVQSFQGKVPGASVDGRGELDLRLADGNWQVDLDLEVERLQAMLESMRLGWNLDGAGTMVLNMQSRPEPTATGTWVGVAKLELIDGSWPLVEQLTAGLEEFHGAQQFEYLSMTVAIHEDRLDLSEIHLISPEVTVEGNLTMFFAGGELAGRVDLINEMGMVQAELSGTLDQVVTSYGPMVLRPTL